MSDHPIEGMMNATLEKIKQMTNSNAVVGEPITTPDGTLIIPVSKISYGFASGGSDLPAKSTPDKELFGGGAGAGVTISPIAFITISNGNVKLLQVDPFHSTVDRIVDMAPDIVDKINSMVKKDNNKEKKIEKEDSELIEQIFKE